MSRGKAIFELDELPPTASERLPPPSWFFCLRFAPSVPVPSSDALLCWTPISPMVPAERDTLARSADDCTPARRERTGYTYDVLGVEGPVGGVGGNGWAFSLSPSCVSPGGGASCVVPSALVGMASNKGGQSSCSCSSCANVDEGRDRNVSRTVYGQSHVQVLIRPYIYYTRSQYNVVDSDMRRLIRAVDMYLYSGIWNYTCLRICELLRIYPVVPWADPFAAFKLQGRKPYNLKCIRDNFAA